MEEKPTSLPHSSEAEKSVLGSVLISASAAEAALEALEPADFYDTAHRDIFFAMQSLYNAGKHIDTVTLVDMLDRQGKLDAAGGTAYITELTLYTPTAANIGNYIGIVEGHSVRRRLLRVSGTISQDAVDTGKDTDAILADAERNIFEISMRKAEDTMESIGPIYSRVYNQIGEYMQLEGRRTGIPTGFIDLDDLTSGFQRSDLIIVAGRPSMGKSAFALNIAAHAAIRENASVAIFSLEMAKEQIVMRMMASETGIDMSRLMKGDIGAPELLKLADRFNTVGEANILIDDTPGIGVSQIRSKCRKMKALHGLDLVIIDYLQLMNPGTKRDSRVLEVSEMSRGLKVLARELNIAVVALAQLSRAPEKRPHDHSPIMSDLRESGSIEQDADLILMLYRPAVYPDTEEAVNGDNTSYVKVVKHRNGALADIKVTWLPELTKYANYADV